MTGLRGWLARMRAGLDQLTASVGRFDVFPDDGLMDLADAVQDGDDDEHADPNLHHTETGCLICRDTLVRIRAHVALMAGFDWRLWQLELGAER